jgi:ribonuclease HI
MINATVICDASFRQVKHEAAHAGWAAWIKGDGGIAVKGYGILTATPPQPMNSTIAEMYAALNGMWLAAKAGADVVLVRSDCMTVVQAIDGQLKKQYLIDLWGNSLHAHGMSHLQVKGRHVKGHGKVSNPATWVNDWCDKHAKFAQHQSRKGKPCLKIS